MIVGQHCKEIIFEDAKGSKSKTKTKEMPPVPVVEETKEVEIIDILDFCHKCKLASQFQRSQDGRFGPIMYQCMKCGEKSTPNLENVEDITFA